jgi:uncharacterized membrane protein
MTGDICLSFTAYEAVKQNIWNMVYWGIIWGVAGGYVIAHIVSYAVKYYKDKKVDG